MADWDYQQKDGTNAVLTFSAPAQNGSPSSFNYMRARVRELHHSWEVVATESHARVNRAFYPHQRAVGQFVLGFELKGYGEFKAWSDFMWNYIKTFMGADRRSMYITIPVRKFARWGIPIKGVYDGDHVGSMVMTPRIVFEAMSDPMDPDVLSPGGTTGYSTPDLAGVGGDQAKFFYPFSSGSLDSSIQPDKLYDYSTPTVDSGVSGALNSIQDYNRTAQANNDAILDQLGRTADDRARAGG